ncbi:MAG: hypothetical protein K0R75_2809, partial [Paenibacillaceae bacterium]|nr:hypothetical protein [Paenibacillaceae bacterium]
MGVSDERGDCSLAKVCDFQLTEDMVEQFYREG